MGRIFGEAPIRISANGDILGEDPRVALLLDISLQFDRVTVRTLGDDPYR